MSFLRSFLSGASTLFGVGPTMPPRPVTALADDWCAVSGDVKAAIGAGKYFCRIEPADRRYCAKLYRPFGMSAVPAGFATGDSLTEIESDVAELAFIQRQIA